MVLIVDHYICRGDRNVGTKEYKRMFPEDCTTSYNSSTRRSLVFRLRYTASLAGVPPNSRLITNKNLASMRVGEAATNNRVHKETEPMPRRAGHTIWVWTAKSRQSPG